MSAEPPSAAGHVDATPTPDGEETTLPEDPPRGEGGWYTRAPNVRPGAGAVRLGIRRLTVDLVVVPGGLLALAGRGVGASTTTAAVPVGTAAGLVALADTVDVRTAWDTAAWPLCC